ncbi:hypothetical protein COLO4_04830 [Corchorus olitorius]|uniref:Uncharacterized protein n=1 Tax=Corchorus olitorius TaxID=93759 RepID=A0A1R3KSL6_9ROSI|nr:hypothetical protein COLO4_04830 [Corchorus olitorius]
MVMSASKEKEKDTEDVKLKREDVISPSLENMEAENSSLKINIIPEMMEWLQRSAIGGYKGEKGSNITWIKVEVEDKGRIPSVVEGIVDKVKFKVVLSIVNEEVVPRQVPKFSPDSSLYMEDSLAKEGMRKT